jgi:hypothetical protein
VTATEHETKRDRNHDARYTYRSVWVWSVGVEVLEVPWLAREVLRL